MSDDSGYESGEGEGEITQMEANILTYLRIKMRMGEMKFLEALDWTISPMANFKRISEEFIFLHNKILYLKKERRIQSK